MSNLVGREYIVNNTGLTGGAGLSRKLAYTRLYLLNTFRKNLFCLEDSSYVPYRDAIRDSLELESRYEVKIPIMVWEECCWGASGCISVNGSWGKFVFGGYMVFHYPDIPSGSNNGFGHNDNFPGSGDIWDPHAGSGGGGGSDPYYDPFGSLGFYVKKQLKSHLLKLKTQYGFSQNIEQLLPMVYSCYTIDPDFDEVTFDYDCAKVGIASRYLDAIQYSGNYAVATGWLSGHIPDLVALMGHVEEHIQEEGIKSYHRVMMDLLDNNEGYVRERFFELWDAIEADPHVLLRPCVEQNTSYPYTFWSDLYNFQPDQSTISALASRGFTYQPLQAGNAAATSVDYYYVEIDQMPDFNNDGTPDSEQQVIDVLRSNFAGLASGEKNDFEFTCPNPIGPTIDNIWWDFKPYEPETDNVQWAVPAPHYKNTVFFIDAGAENSANNAFADKGAIIISQASNCCWIGSTINTPLSGSQPFSGQRQWGITTLPNGKKAFYTKAADRAYTSGLVRAAGMLPDAWNCDDDTYYNIAHETWKNMMLQVAAFVKQYGGQIYSEPGYTEPAITIAKARIPFDELDSKLKSNSPVNFISCE